MTVILPPTYSPGKFVDREEEISRLDDIIRTGRSRAIIFRGERGVGKSWLSAHWGHHLKTRRNIQILRLDLKEYKGKAPEWAIDDLIRRISRETGGPDRLLGADLPEMSRTLTHHIRNIGKTLILFLDHVYESDWSLLALLEEYILAPLIAEPKVFIVITGRGKPYPWRTPALSIRAEGIDLEPFPDPRYTEQQIQKQARQSSERAKEIHALTRGNPLANYLLAVESPPARVSDSVIESLLEPVPEERRKKVKEYIEALCVLRSFDDESVTQMLAAYTGNDSYRKWTYAQARQVWDELIQWAFAQWDAEQRAYVLDPIVRQMAEEYLKQNHPDKWKALHQAAFQLYDRWAKEYHLTKERWEKEREYHRERLKEAQ